MALTIFKQLIEVLDNIDNENRVLDDKAIYSAGLYSETKMKEISIRESNLKPTKTKDMSKFANKNEQTQQTSQTTENVFKKTFEEDKKEIKIVNEQPKVVNVPSVPSVPIVPKIPVAPKLPPPFKKPIVVESEETKTTEHQKKEEKSEKQETKGGGGFSLEEIAIGIKLKPIDKNLNEKRPVPKINKAETNILQFALNEAIKVRRYELTKHDVEKSASEDSDWSD